MDLSFLALQSLNGLASASSLFITACGLTLVFGVTRIVNFAHGSLYMIGAYTAATLVPRLLEYSYGPVPFWAGILAAAFIVGLAVLLAVYRPPGGLNWAGTFFGIGFVIALALGGYLAWSITRARRG